MDALSLLLSRFAVRAGVFYTGQICGVHGFQSDRLHGHLHIVEQGPVDVVRHDGRRSRIDKPTLLFFPRAEPHSLMADDRRGAKVLCATVQFGIGNSNPITESLPAMVAIGLEQLEGAGSLLELVALEAFGRRPGAQAAVDRLCDLLIIRLLRHCLDTGITSGGTLAGLADARLAKALGAMHREPSRPWGLAAMAAEAGLSRARFAARFREVTGQTPADYLAAWRITVGQDLLKSGRAPKQVAVECGYGSPSAFTRAFMRRVGVPPSEWLRQFEAGTPRAPRD